MPSGRRSYEEKLSHEGGRPHSRLHFWRRKGAENKEAVRGGENAFCRGADVSERRGGETAKHLEGRTSAWGEVEKTCRLWREEGRMSSLDSGTIG